MHYQMPGSQWRLVPTDAFSSSVPAVPWGGLLEATDSLLEPSSLSSSNDAHHVAGRDPSTLGSLELNTESST